MTRSPHLSEEELARLQDGELGADKAKHVESCTDCEERLRDLRAGAAAYLEYRDAIRAPLLPAAPKPWRTLHALIAEDETSSTRRFLWWPVLAASAAALLVGVILFRPPGDESSDRVHELLTRSAAQTAPQTRVISLRVHGRTLVRPAVMSSDAGIESDPDMVHFQAKFIAAHYSWQEPLSARSFQGWRSTLPHKHDSVSVTGKKGEEQSYRVTTESPAGILRSASLTLRARDLQPVSGAFRFEGEEPLELEEASGEAAVRTKPARGASSPAEAAASPADTLRVLAVLNEIGADTGEPISVEESPSNHRITVHASGLSPDRLEQLARVLKALPRVDLETRTAGPDVPVSRTAQAERYSGSIPPLIRQRFESRFGGPAGLQQTTDQALETSATLFANAHAIEVLEKYFPIAEEARLNAADRELLLTLRQRHLAELTRLVERLHQGLTLLLRDYPDAPQLPPVAADFRDSWQARVPVLMTSARETDKLLNRLLAGSYAQPEGEEMLRDMAMRLKLLEWSIRSQ